MADDQTGSASAPISSSLVDILESRYPGRFSSDQTEQLRVQLRQLLDAAAKLRQYSLANSDEPAPVFQAHRPEA